MLIKFLCNCFIFTFILILIFIFIMIKINIIIVIMIIIIIISVMIIVMIIIIITTHIVIMETIFMNTENSKTNESHRFKLDLADKLNLKNPKKNMALVNLSIYYTWKNIKSEYNNNKFKIFAPTWNETFDLPDDSYFIDDIQGYFEFIIKKHETLTENQSIQIESFSK